MPDPSEQLTPAMRQYMQAKQELQADTILLFRMGDFYELFFDDAKTAAPIMDVVLTARAGVPMCGVPFHAVQMYVARLLQGGYKVAIAEQMEDPKNAKGLVKRDIIQVITPGTVVEDDLLHAVQANYLVAVRPLKDKTGLALLDLSTGDFRLTEANSPQALETELNRLKPAECITTASTLEAWKNAETSLDFPPHIVWTTVDEWLFDLPLARDTLCRHFQVASLDGYGCRGLDAAVAAAGAILAYARNNLRRDIAQVTTLTCYSSDDCMTLDRISQRNLELVEPIFADAKGNTLLSVIDQTQTPMGSRLLREWLLRPLRDKDAINRRLDAIQTLLDQPLTLTEIQDALKSVRDIERIITRLNVGNANARDLLVLKHALNAIPDLRAILNTTSDALLNDCRNQLTEHPQLSQLIEEAIVDEPPVAIKDGGLFKFGFNEQLDTLRKASTEGKDWIAAYQTSEAQRTGIKNLKVRYNKVFGYFIEISKTNLDLVPPEYMRKQTIANGERFITPELKEIEDKVLGAEEKSRALEFELFQQLRETICQHTATIQTSARAVAVIDCLASLTTTASAHQYIRPVITEDPILRIQDGRHPVLDARLTSEPFVPNDVDLDTRDAQLALITGPNMAGKSTYIRQVALLAIMAQMGSFIPASSATVGLIDRVFTRVGAADDISRGQSTFMVEMVETANILNNATPNSLIILDEIGRGTSTYDGLSLAWAIAEHLHDTPSAKARTLFATHYHELTDLAKTKSGVRNFNVLVSEQGEKITFLRKIIPGCADKSYGLHVARLAGMPRSIIQRATEVLDNLENDNNKAGLPQLLPPKKRRARRLANENQMTLDLSS